MEMVACAGAGKNGSLVVMQEGIRPELSFGYDLPGSLGVWAVRNGQLETDKKRRQGGDLNESEVCHSEVTS